MSGLVFTAVLAAAVLHAGWNALAKAIPDQRVAAGVLGVPGLVMGAAGAAILSPPDAGSWPFLAVSSLLQAAYLVLLVHAYRHGEFSQVYPLARGLPPPLVTVVSLSVLGEQITDGQLAGVVLVSMALTALVFAGSGRTRHEAPSTVALGPPARRGGPGARTGLGLAAATGVVIAAYTLVDGVGVRQSGAPLSYAAWLFLLHGGLVVAASRVMYGRGFAAAARRSARLGLLGGVLAVVAYGTVLWAQSLAPLPLVSALRETSLLFAGGIGARFFAERFSPTRMVATAAAVAGIILLQVG